MIVVWLEFYWEYACVVFGGGVVVALVVVVCQDGEQEQS